MVASIAQMAKGAERYYTSLAKEDYYVNGGEPEGRWIGKAAETLGFAGKVSAQHLSDAIAGYDPTGKHLVRNAGARNRQCGWDICFSAPKSVSTIWALADQKQRQEIERIHNQAVETAVDFLQKNVVWSRTGAGGKIWKRAEAVVAAFNHGTSRDGDPNLHTHTLWANIGLRADGKTGTIVSQKLFDYKMLAGAIYRSCLAENLSNQLGLQTEKVEWWFEVKDVPKTLLDHFSQRSLTIKNCTGEGATAKEKAAAALLTRQSKKHFVRSELYETWKYEAKDFGFGREQVTALFGRHKAEAKDKQTEQVTKSINQAIAEICESSSYFTRETLLRQALDKTVGNGISPSQVIDSVQAKLKTKDFAEIGDHEKTAYFTTSRQQKLEQDLLNTAKKLKERRSYSISEKRLGKVINGTLISNAIAKAQAFVHDKLPFTQSYQIAKPDFKLLNDEQRAVLKDILCTQGRLKTFSGRAGTGKTFLLSAAREALESRGLKVYACAVSGKAAQEIAQQAGINSETVAMRLFQLNGAWSKRLLHDLKQYRRALLGQKTFAYESFKLDKKSVLIIDEASMISTKQLSQLLKHAEKAKAKVILCGDVRQLPSVEHGGGFCRLFKETNGIELTKTIRHKTPWLKRAANLFAEEDQHGALTEFLHANRLLFGKDASSIRDRLLKKWNKHRTEDLSETIIVARRRKDVADLNQSAQDIRRRNNELGATSYTWNGQRYFVGDRIAFHRIDRKLGVVNGDRGTIKHILHPFNSHMVQIMVQLDRGQTLTFTPRRLKSKSDISLGYASTIHKAQGLTVDKTFAFFDARASKELAYVALSRSRYDTFIAAQTKFVGEDLVENAKAKAQLAQSMAQSQAKKLAIDQENELKNKQQQNGSRNNVLRR